MDEKRQEIIVEIRRVAELLNTNSLSFREFKRNCSIEKTIVDYYFGSWNKAVEAAGLLPNTPAHIGGKPVITDDEFLEEIIRLTSRLGKVPTKSDMSAFGRFSPSPYRARWGKFSEAIKAAYTKYGLPPGISEGDLPNTLKRQVTIPERPNRVAAAPQILSSVAPSRKKIQYGEPIDFRGLRHAPVNEQGVVYVFGMVSRELGFLIESVRTAYPDCEGKRCVDEKRQLWEHVLIEFEFKSSNFREHGHNPNECDLIVCWIHDWPDCPLEVLELRSAISDLSGR